MKCQKEQVSTSNVIPYLRVICKSYSYCCADCLPPRLHHDQIVMLEKERALLIEVHTCSVLRVHLQNKDTRTVYLVQFASSDSGNNSVYISHTEQTVRRLATSEADCSARRQLWLSWGSGVVAGGEGLNPGKKELVRLTQTRETCDIVSMATLVTTANKTNADFTIIPGT